MEKQAVAIAYRIEIGKTVFTIGGTYVEDLNIIFVFNTKTTKKIYTLLHEFLHMLDCKLTGGRLSSLLHLFTPQFHMAGAEQLTQRQEKRKREIIDYFNSLTKNIR